MALTRSRATSSRTTSDAAAKRMMRSSRMHRTAAGEGQEIGFRLAMVMSMAVDDFVEDHPKTDWVGNCNELNAGYATDGYARVEETSISSHFSSFGVGELSTTYTIAGACSVLHIVRVPSTSQQKNKPMLLHTLGDGRDDAYFRAAGQFTIAATSLESKLTAAAKIDRVLTECVVHARPVYLMLSTDLTYERIPAYRLKTPLRAELLANDPDVEAFAQDKIVRLVDEALRDLVKRTGFPAYAAPMGKVAIYEHYPEIKEKVGNAKFILSFGALKSDFNTGYFTYHIPAGRTIELHSASTTVQFAGFPGIGMKHLLPKLTEWLRPMKKGALLLQVPYFKYLCPKEDNEDITQSWLFGVLEVPFPSDAMFISQIVRGSIEQLTVQELSVMLRSHMKPIIFVLNTVGKRSRGNLRSMQCKYNDISNRRWTKLLEILGSEEGKTCQSYEISTKTEVSKLLDDPKFAAAEKFQLVELIMDPHDAPQALKRQAELSGKTNRYFVFLNIMSALAVSIRP
ncbi:uncharacterized protein LAESUDRAFT_738886 [Laetiporus sulphureus 93-53]|uniref:Uncharacterized protein n=1 Tax=Laetiporus sulphureus 93-53 TaxID=1314785 RepID=A0A165C483_9APHY|nr:uncharacterized protein LAESUDRAFT_738886 [Laetiporus sulphureus 93-53]KZT02176.1 hypothetical protein LAESUDRAFT_738886 [Laetiporus sulphureus 93-53]